MRDKEKDTINIVIGKNMAKLRAKFNLFQKEIAKLLVLIEIRIKIMKLVIENLIMCS